MALRTGQQATDAAVHILAQFQSGDIKPISTGVGHLDEMLLGGLLPGTVLGIVARSGQGKTYELEKIQRHIMRDPEIILIQGNYELEVLKLLTRDLAYQTKKSTREIMFNKPEGEDLNIFKDVCSKFRREGTFFQDEPVSAVDFETDIMGMINSYPDKKIVVTIDNLENVLNTEGSQKGSMDKLLAVINSIKKRHPFICFIILNQANNELTKRSLDPKGHRPMETDIYGTDQLLKICDVLLFKVIPTKLGVHEKYMSFGKHRYEWLDEYKLPSSGKATSFDPFGNVFYFYLKVRQTEDNKNIKDLHIHTMYTREDVGAPPRVDIAIPTFDKKTTTVDIPIVPIKFETKAIVAARDSSEDNPF